MDAIQTKSTCNMSPIAIEQIKTWLETCEREHDGCKQQGAIQDSKLGRHFVLPISVVARVGILIS